MLFPFLQLFLSLFFILEPALVTFEDPVKEVVQSKGRAYITVIRQQRTAGRVILPWKLVPEVAESPYIGVVGEL